MSVAWILPIYFLSGFVMGEQTSVRSRSNAAVSRSARYDWEREEQAETTSIRPRPPPGVTPSFPLPLLCGDVLSWEKNYRSPRCGLVAEFMFRLWACFISMQRPEFPK